MGVSREWPVSDCCSTSGSCGVQRRGALRVLLPPQRPAPPPPGFTFHLTTRVNGSQMLVSIEFKALKCGEARPGQHAHRSFTRSRQEAAASGKPATIASYSIPHQPQLQHVFYTQGQQPKYPFQSRRLGIRRRLDLRGGGWPCRLPCRSCRALAAKQAVSLCVALLIAWPRHLLPLVERRGSQGVGRPACCRARPCCMPGTGRSQAGGAAAAAAQAHLAHAAAQAGSHLRGTLWRHYQVSKEAAVHADGRPEDCGPGVQGDGGWAGATLAWCGPRAAPGGPQRGNQAAPQHASACAHYAGGTRCTHWHGRAARWARRGLGFGRRWRR